MRVGRSRFRVKEEDEKEERRDVKEEEEEGCWDEWRRSRVIERRPCCRAESRRDILFSHFSRKENFVAVGFLIVCVVALLVSFFG